MTEPDIAAGLLTLMHRRAQEAGMLARTVVVQRRRLLAAPGQIARHRRVERPVAAAFERRAVEPGFRQHLRRQTRMAVLTRMGGAGQRQFTVAETVGIGGAGLDQRNALEHLDRRAREHRPQDVAAMVDHLARTIDERETAAMETLHETAAGHFHENRVCHWAPRP